MAKDTLIAYPDHNKEFKIETDASDYQLGRRIFQEHEDEDDPAKLVNRDVAFYSCKLSSAQKNYTTIEKEMLSVVEVLKEYRPMLLGAKITIYTDHRNLTYKLSQYATQRILRWRLLLEEFGAKFVYKPGKENVIAGALSRVPSSRLERESYHEMFPKLVPPLEDQKLTECLLNDPELFGDTQVRALNEQMAVGNPTSVAECYLETPIFDKQGRMPFQFKTLKEYQQCCDAVKVLPIEFPERFSVQNFVGMQS